MAKDSNLLLTNQLKMKKDNSNNKRTALKSQTTLNGMMTFGKNDNGLRLMDFACCEEVTMKSFTGDFKVQAMRDGNVYITEKKKRVHNKPLFREDHSSLSLGFDGVYYFTFRLSAGLVDELPEKLAHEALTIAQKVVNEILYTKAEEVTL